LDLGIWAKKKRGSMIYNLGSINADHVYGLTHLPAPGETLAARSYARLPGGKGANQSIAVARAGGLVQHIGAVGPDGGWMVDGLARHGVDVTHVARCEAESGHAVVYVDDFGENAIVIHAGANRALRWRAVEAALAQSGPGDWLMMQNETSLQVEAARFAQERGVRVAYSAAPFEVETVRAVVPFVTLLIVNEVEAAQMARDLGEVEVPVLIVTRGADGADWRGAMESETVTIPAPKVDPVDTTGAGDTFAGYLVAGLAEGLTPRIALQRAVTAAAIAVTRPGASASIPRTDEVAALLAQE
jgi:ribokinase